ncbi:MAG: hypothetical protein IT229_06955 [Flavobacteriales bacterium]|nr:hypothetical protein [Flavobacteriales bacterium]
MSTSSPTLTFHWLRTLALISIALFAVNKLPCQAASDPDEALRSPIAVATYAPLAFGGKLLRIPMDFAGSASDINDVRARLNGAQVVRVDIVYSDYPKGRDLTGLNTRRVERLRELAPDLFERAGVEWRLVKQTDCRTEDQARTLFHGIVIAYRPRPTKETRSAEVALVRDLFKATPTMPKAMVIPSGSVAPRISKEENDTVVLSELSRTSGTAPRLGGSSPTSSDHTAVITFSPWWSVDSTIPQVMDRNQWKDAVVVADLTGSMAPYTAQLVLWTKMATLKDAPKGWVFFNDGDTTPDARKIIGRTGGIYTASTTKYTEVQALAIKTMTAGSGGDGPENNVEAVLAAEKHFPKGDLVMIADNWAPIKDKSLTDRITRPVHVILCGVAGGVNVEYLELARATGGSVHTMESDLVRLADLNEGERFDLDGEPFMIKEGRIVSARVATTRTR